MVTNSLKKKYLVAVLIVATFAVVLSIMLPPAYESRMVADLKRVSAEELSPLEPSVTTFMLEQSPRKIIDCSDRGTSYTETRVFCRDMVVYDVSSESVSEADRDEALKNAKALDEVLLQNGWKADRQQDEIHTVVAAASAEPVGPFSSRYVPFHKNIGNGISCNLSVGFSGPRDFNSKVNSPTVNRFSCQKHISYFQLHFSQRPGIGG